MGSTLQRRRHQLQPEVAPPADAKPADGAFQAMDQVANWVRFADTKATILIAGVGVVLTMVMTNADSIVEAIKLGQPEAAVIYPLVVLTAAAFLWTIFWLVYAIGPRRKTTLPGVNRFAWPTLTNVEPKDLVERGRTEDVREDAWRQVVDLSDLAERKFTASRQAIRGLGAVIVFGVLLVAMSIAFTAGQEDPPAPPSRTTVSGSR